MTTYRRRDQRRARYAQRVRRRVFAGGEPHYRQWATLSSKNWFWLVGYLAGKALLATISGDRESTASLHQPADALYDWHSAIRRARGVLILIFRNWIPQPRW